MPSAKAASAPSDTTPSSSSSSGSKRTKTSETGASQKRARSGFFAIPPAANHRDRSEEEMKAAYDDAVRSHPFFDRSFFTAEVHGHGVLRDGKGNIIGVLIPGGLPAEAAKLAADVLRSAAVRTSLRSSMFGGESPLSGIAGYYDYRGSPIELKNRKTSFTYEHLSTWKNVFPMIDYVSELYKTALPENWKAQNAAIPDLVRLHGSPFSTLTINQRFRTASHTDAGDFDNGFGALAVLEGHYQGLHLSFGSFGVCVNMQPGDVLLFNTHHFHSNTEVEILSPSEDWDRLTCVFYYRSALGDNTSMEDYRRRLRIALETNAQPPPVIREIVAKDNGTNLNKPATVYPVLLTPFVVAASIVGLHPHSDKLLRLHKLIGSTLTQTPPMSGAALPSTEKSRSTLKDGASRSTRSSVSRDPVKKQSNSDFLVTCKVEGESEDSDECAGADESAEEGIGAEAFFGEPLTTHDGIVLRDANGLLHTQLMSIVRAPANGGFSETPSALNAATEQYQLLTEENLKEVVTAELLTMWKDSQSAWLRLVKADWEKIVKSNPSRTDFSWHNRSEMNSAFFDFCEVAKQVMCDLLNKPTPAKNEEQSFWLLFAAYCNRMCVTENKMPEAAMSMKKLNVKLKDFNFGGTRYFKDMPEAEQQRRVERKRRIELARQSPQEEVPSLNWLKNDAFDYQSENCDVDYAALGFPLPQENIARCGLSPEKMQPLPAASPSTDIRVCVVMPHGFDAPFVESPTDIAFDDTDALIVAERRRLLENPAAKRLLQSNERRNGKLPLPVTRGALRVTYASHDPSKDCAAISGSHDVIVLQHVLSQVKSDEQVTRIIASYAAHASACVMIVETDVLCRSYYLLPMIIRDRYDAVSGPAFARLLHAAYGVRDAEPRSHRRLVDLLPSKMLANYTLHGSPLNSEVIIIQGTDTSQPVKGEKGGNH